MGNAATKEQRQVPARLRPGSRRASSTTASGPDSPASIPPSGSQHHHPVYSSRSGRGSQPNLSSIFGIGHGSDRERDLDTFEARRESKHERDKRKLERDRAYREKERSRSMREENVDGGYLVTQGVYTGLEDFNKHVVRQLMVRTVQDGVQTLTFSQIERRLAPFWKGLNDHSVSWTEHQLIAAARGLPIPAADAIPTEEQSGPFSPTGPGGGDADSGANALTAPSSSRAQSYNSESSLNQSPTQPNFPPPSSAVPTNTSSSGPAMFRGRSKTLASLTSSSKISHGEMTPRELRLPKEPFVHGQPIEAYLYKDVLECPICFLYYPPYLNKTRCCDQNICSECFVQIKRPDPHLPEHQEASAQSTGEPPDPDALTSEIATCPFCKQPDLGVTFEPPPFRRGLTYVKQASDSTFGKVASAMSSSTSLASAMSGGKASSADTARKRAQSIAPNNTAVITTDRVRPDWYQKLEGARAHAQRRSAAATALHTAAYMMGNRGQESDRRGFTGFGRRTLLRRGSGPGSSSRDETSQMDLLALMAERYGSQATDRIAGGQESAPPPRGSSRRVRIDDLEEMMVMEAIRMSLASEEERRKNEEDEPKGSKKEAKKEAKRKEKELKKAEKAAKKSGIYSGSASQSRVDLRGEGSDSAGKGKAVQQPNPNTFAPDARVGFPPSTPSSPYLPDAPFDQDQAQQHLERARRQLQPETSPFSSPFDSQPHRPSHLRNRSNVSLTDDDDDDSIGASLRGGFRGSGSGSSFDVSPSGSGINIANGGTAALSGTPPGGGAGVEPMFNFRSLAAMVGDDEKAEASHVEHVEEAAGTVSRSQSTGTADQAYHDAFELAPPDVNIIAPSRTGSDLASMAQASDIKIPGPEAAEGPNTRVVS